MRKRTIILLLAAITFFAYKDYHHFTDYFERKRMLRVRDKVISVNYDTLNLAAYDTSLKELRYLQYDYAGFRIYDGQSFNQCIYHYNKDTLILNFGKGTVMKHRMSFKIIQKDLIFNFLHGGNPVIFKLHDEPIDNVDTLSLVIDTTNQTNLKIQLGLHYHEIVNYGIEGDDELFNRYFRINGCMVCDTLSQN